MFKNLYAKLRSLGLSEGESYSMLVDAPSIRSNPRDFFELIDGVFHYLNEMILSHPAGRDLVDKIWENTWYEDGVVQMLSSLKAFDFFRSRTFRFTLIMFVATIVGGILLLSGTTPSTVGYWPFKAGVACIIVLFVISVGLLLVAVERLVSDVPRSHIVGSKS